MIRSRMVKKPFSHLSIAASRSGSVFYEKPDWGIFEIIEECSGLLLPKESLLILSTENRQGIRLQPSYMPVEATLQNKEYMIMAYPRDSWELGIRVEKGGSVKVLAMTLDWLHQIIGSSWTSGKQNQADSRFNLPKGAQKMVPSMQLAMHQLFFGDQGGLGQILFKESKILEFLALMIVELNGEKPEVGHCPFLDDEEEEKRIRNARSILMEEMEKPNSIRELARRVGTNEYKLKTGFKHLYGQSIHAYLVNQRLEKARYLLTSSRRPVSEVAMEVGYTNPSHFIAAFRKKFGTTPKKLS